MKNIICFFAIWCLFGCKDELDLKPTTNIVLPETAQELESLLEYTSLLSRTSALAQVSADEYFIPNLSAWQSTPSITARNAAIWMSDIYAGETKIQDWVNPYSAIFYANSVLDVLKTQNINSDAEKTRIKGRALFIRAYSFYTLVSIFSKSYSESAGTDLGIPLKLNPNVEEIIQRSTLQESYDQIIKDALNAGDLLNKDIVVDKRNQPSKVATFAFLARVYLSMRKYEEAEIYADKALSAFSKLTDFKTLNRTAASAFTVNSEETIYYSSANVSLGNFYIGSYGTYGVDPSLLGLYEVNDLRLSIYFTKNSLGNFIVKPINSPFQEPFSGLATDELYLIKAECLARRHQISQSMDLINQLRVKRWDPNITNPSKPYQNVVANSDSDALDLVLIERRKALIWRGVRWTDLKRLNLEGRNITLTRNISGTIHTLEPNSLNYILPIPDDEIFLSGIKQNSR